LAPLSFPASNTWHEYPLEHPPSSIETHHHRQKEANDHLIIFLCQVDLEFMSEVNQFRLLVDLFFQNTNRLLSTTQAIISLHLFKKIS